MITSLTFLLNSLQLTMKKNNNGIFGELTPPSLENLVADLGSSKMTSDDGEDSTDENVREEKVDERNAEDEKQGKKGAEGVVNREGLAEQSEDDGKKNASKQKKEIENFGDDKITRFEINANRPLIIVPQCSSAGDGGGMQNVHKNAVPNIVTADEGTTHQFKSLKNEEETNGMNVTFDNEKKENDEEGKRKEIEGLKDDKAKTSGKRQPDMWALAVPYTKRGHVPKEKELSKSEPLGSTEVKITIEQEEERGDNNEDDDRNISSNDLLCFAWQIAQGMVRKLCSERIHITIYDKHNQMYM